jgi:hypothetical protein
MVVVGKMWKVRLLIRRFGVRDPGGPSGKSRGYRVLSVTLFRYVPIAYVPIAYRNFFLKHGTPLELAFPVVVFRLLTAHRRNRKLLIPPTIHFLDATHRVLAPRPPTRSEMFENSHCAGMDALTS